MSTLRNNIVSVVLIVGVLAVTGLNQFVTKANCDLFLAGVEYNNAEMARNKMVHDLQIVQAIKEEQLARITTVAESEAERARNAEAEFDDLVRRFVQLRATLNQAGIEIYGLQEALRIADQHIAECHRRMKEAGIEPPEYPPPPETVDCPNM